MIVIYKLTFFKDENEDFKNGQTTIIKIVIYKYHVEIVIL